MAGQNPVSGAAGDHLSPEPGARKHIDWTARYHLTALEVQRYTRFVVIMKRALPMAAAALLIAVVAYSLQPRLPSGRKLTLTMAKIGIINNDLMMIKPKLTGVDGNNNPYVVTAEEAVQDPQDNKRAMLKHVDADLTQKSGSWLSLTATRGWLDQAKQRLRLEGLIDVYSDKGYEAHTSLADIDMRSGIVVGKRQVYGQGPLGTFRADEFRIDRNIGHAQLHADRTAAKQDKSKLYLYGNVRMTIYRRGAAHS